MNLSIIRGTAFAALTTVALTGCVDDKYDLSDIDTTAGIKVNDLVVPVNIDAVTLESIINLKDGESIEVIDGQYAVVKTGTFSSDPVRINAIDMAAPAIDSSTHTCVLIPAENLYDISSGSSSFDYRTTSVTDCIVSVEEIGTNWTVTITMTLRELAGTTPGAVTGTVTDLVFRLPKGLTLARNNDRYDSATGLYQAGTVEFVNGVASVSIEAISINAAEAGVIYDYASHTATLTGECAVEGGMLSLVNSSTGFALLHIDTRYDMSRIKATTFSGEIKYDIIGCDFDNVDLSSLPDFLSQAGTDIRIANPQIYLDIDDPLCRYALTARTGMTISSYSENGLTGSYSLDAPGYFDISTNAANRRYYYCLSPQKPDRYYVDGAGRTQWVGYKALSDVLSGDGLPRRLSITLDNPQLPVQRVSDIVLGEQLGAVTGEYTFYAPLALVDGSTIAYTGTMDGWGSEDLDAVTISALTVTATADTDLPVEAELTAYPIDADGNRIGNVEITGTTLQPMAQGQQITLTMNGTVSRLDGLRYIVKVKSDDSKVLTPQMSISLKDVKARVTGEYIKEL